MTVIDRDDVPTSRSSSVGVAVVGADLELCGLQSEGEFTELPLDPVALFEHDAPAFNELKLHDLLFTVDEDAALVGEIDRGLVGS